MVKVSKVSSSTRKIGKVSKTIGALGTVISKIPDLTEVAGRTIDATAPIIEKNIDRYHHYKNSLIKLDNVVDLPLDVARRHLENKGFVVTPVLVKPARKYANEREMEVVAIHPKLGKYEPGTLVKLYYLDQATIVQSQTIKHTQKEKTKQSIKSISNLPERLSDLATKRFKPHFNKRK